MQIEFDAAKDAGNRTKHGVSLAFAEQVLTDPRLAVIRDVRKDYGEARYIAYGKCEERLWVCVYTLRGSCFRIISLRKANQTEASRYDAYPR